MSRREIFETRGQHAQELTVEAESEEKKAGH
jgi:hypothetical protein